MTDDDILHLARALRPELPTLIDDQASHERLVRNIAAAEAGALAPDALFQELASEPAIRRWLMQRMGNDRAEVRGFGMTRSASFQALAGHGSAMLADEFVCPEPDCPSRWFRQRVGQEPPLCERHGVRLVRKS